MLLATGVLIYSLKTNTVNASPMSIKVNAAPTCVGGFADGPKGVIAIWSDGKYSFASGVVR